MTGKRRMVSRVRAIAVQGSTAVLGAAVLLGAAAHAGQPDSNTLGDIVVTAQKTRESLSEVPISISALTGAALDAQHITDYADLSRAVPNLSFTSFGGPGQSNIEIRGVSSQAGSATTGIYLDDVPINVLNIYTTGATEPRFFDIDRVEVLRGPQGTLYGASSMGGTLHFVSNSPDLNGVSGSAHASVGATRGGGVNYQGDSVVNLPLVEGLAALRLGALYDHESGWIDRANGDGTLAARHINDVDTTVLRATVKVQPSDALSITPAAFLQRVRTGGQDLFGLALPKFESPTLLPETARDQSAITSVTVDLALGGIDLTSVSGYFWRQDVRNIDGTVYDSQYIGGSLQQQYGYGGAALAALPAPVQFNTNVNQLHQELRAASRPQGPGERWSWIAGLYYSRTRTALLDNEHIPGFNNTFESTYGASPAALLGAAFPDDLVYYALSEFVNTQQAAFGQATFTILPGLKVTAGARYEQAAEDLAFTTTGYLSGGTAPFSGTARGHALTPKGVIAYDVSASTLLYASAAEGYRDGGVNRPVPVPSCSADLAGLGLKQAPTQYKSDKLWSYELGVKSRAWGDSLVMSGAVYDIRWSDIQTDIILPTCTFDIKDNIGSADSKGVEAELEQRVSDRVKVTLGGNYTAARIVQPVTLLGVQKGDHVPGVPEYSVDTAIDYSQSFALGRGTLRADAQWTGPSQGTIIHGDPDFNRPAYFVMGASASLHSGNFDLSLFVTNLLDEDKAIQRPSVAGVEYGVRVRPRTYGIGAGYSF